MRETRCTFRSHFGKSFEKRPLKDSNFVGCNSLALGYSDILSRSRRIECLATNQMSLAAFVTRIDRQKNNNQMDFRETVYRVCCGPGLYLQGLWLRLGTFRNQNSLTFCSTVCSIKVMTTPVLSYINFSCSHEPSTHTQLYHKRDYTRWASCGRLVCSSFFIPCVILLTICVYITNYLHFSTMFLSF